MVPAVEKRPPHRIGLGPVKRVIPQNQAAEPPAPPSQHSLLAPVPGHHALCLDLSGKHVFERRLRNRRRQEDARLASIAVELGRDEIIGRRQRIVLSEKGAAAVAEPELA